MRNECDNELWTVEDAPRKVYRRNWRIQDRPHYLMQRYGLTPKQYAEMLLAQNGVCAICGKPPSEDKSLAVDHDHKTGQVRALLCHVCNRQLGLFEARFAEFSAYLRKFILER
ncbi:MAG: hypothetical protein EHM35_00780 [Planctomycetaceae bacterium]|nr:MAG: hypothetical protein EHM35_00780 [Planctomycetaceae bacterium]